MTDNARAIDQHRALNYLALRYPGTYNTVADCHTWDFALTGVDARPSALSSTRKVVEVILSITNRKTTSPISSLFGFTYPRRPFSCYQIMAYL
jgi:hypothetical protein